MASAANASKRWAGLDDWPAHRLTIKRLYKDEDKTLNDVMEIMEREHGFFATKKMYNKRLKDWGLTKNFKAAEVLAILHSKKRRDDAGKASYMAIRDERVDPDRLATYLRRNKTVLGRFEAGQSGPVLPTAMDVVCRTPSPAPAPAGPAYQVEEILHLLSGYVDGNFAAGTWYLEDGYCYTRNEKKSDALLDLVWNRFVFLRVSRNRSYVDVYRILDPAFAALESIVRQQPPEATSFLISLIVKLYTAGQRTIADMLTRYLANMTQRVLGAAHPLHGIWTRLSLLLNPENREVGEALEQVLMLNINAAKGHSGGSGGFVESLYVNYLDVYSNLREDDDIAAELWRYLSRVEGQAEDSYSLWFTGGVRQRYHGLLIEQHYQRGQFEAAVLECEAGAALIQPLCPWWKSETLGTVAWRQGKLDKAEENYKRALQIQRGCSDSASIITLSFLHGVLFEAGKLEEATQVYWKRLDLLEKIT